MTGTAPPQARTRDHHRPRPKPHHRRWIIAGVAALAVLLVLVAVAAWLATQPGPQPLALPAAASAAAPVGPLDGTWNLGAGSVVGFRIRQHVLGKSSEIVGRTNTVTGAVIVAHGQLTAASFRIDLTTVKVNDEMSPQFARRLDTQHYPSATFALTQPIPVGSDLDTGATATATATGQLTLRGVRRLVSCAISGHRNGPALEATGSIPVRFADWGIPPPTSYGPLGSLDDHGVAEFLLVLQRH
jgi:polyisoprenoid-binding protein YceI